MNKRGFTVINIPFKTVILIIVLSLGAALMFFIIKNLLSVELLPK